MAMFVLYGFDTAGALAEETDNPRCRAPGAILLALASVGAAGSLLVFTAVRAVADLHDPALALGSGGLPYVVKSVLGQALGLPFLAAVALAIMVCTLTVHAAAVRLVFAMARDNHLPFARALARVNEGTRTPALPAVLVGLAAVGLLAFNADFPHVIEALASVAVVWANLAYLFVTVPLLHRRLVGGPGDGPRRKAGFSLGRWGPARERGRRRVGGARGGQHRLAPPRGLRRRLARAHWRRRPDRRHDRRRPALRPAGPPPPHSRRDRGAPAGLPSAPPKRTRPLRARNPPVPEPKPRKRLRVRLRPRRLTRPRR